VTPNGVRTWFLIFTSPKDGKRARVTLGAPRTKQTQSSRLPCTSAQNGFYYETEKVFHTGRRMKVTEYALPDVGAQRLWLQNRMPEVYREQSVTKHQLTADDAFLQFLDKMDEQSQA